MYLYLLLGINRLFKIQCVDLVVVMHSVETQRLTCVTMPVETLSTVPHSKVDQNVRTVPVDVLREIVVSFYFTLIIHCISIAQQ